MSLHPPLSWIEAGLFPQAAPPSEAPGDALAVADETSKGALSQAEEQGSGWTPDQLATLVRLAERAGLQADESLAPAPAQIRRLHLKSQPTRPVHLLVQQLGPLFARGWPVMCDVDYASDRDWVLQDDDVQRPLQASTRVVQLWNPIVLPISALGASVNTMEPDAWESLQAVSGALAAVQRQPISMPRTVVSVTERLGHEFVTGAPLAPGARHLEDRERYQSLCTRWADETMRDNVPSVGRIPMAPGSSTPSAAPAPAPQRRTRSNTLWQAAALASVAVLAVFIAQPHWRTRPDAAVSEERGAGQSATQRTRLIVHLAPAAKVADLTTWLADWGGQLVSGPNETGALTIEVPDTAKQEAMRILSASPIVERAEELKP